MRGNRYPKRHQNQHKIMVILSVMILLALSCGISGSDPSLQLTKSSLDVQMTVMAQQSGVNQQATEMAAAATQMAAGVQATVLSQQATMLAEQASQINNQQQQQQQPATEPPPPPAEPQPVQTEAPPVVDVESQIKSAKILLFEDMAGTGQLEYVQEALDMGGYKYKDDGSAQGWFKDDLLSTTDWNLIIAASESRTKIQGEFFVYMLDHINRGTAVIIEHWALDSLSEGKVAPILSKCGVAVHRDWFVPLDVVPDLSVWPLVPDHPIWHEPNDGISLRAFSNFWNTSTDKGDLLKIKSSGDAVLVAGTRATSKMEYGTLVSCLGGRLIIQTHSSHHYRRDDITRLWQNMIYQALKNHFLHKQQP